MQKFLILTDALAYIEANLESPLEQERIAQACFASLSALQKVFRYALRISVKAYIDRRRLTQAAKRLLESRETITDIALRYQYQSPEVFTRAFRRLWGISPSAFRRERRFAGLYPRVEDIIIGGDGMTRNRVDISELYDALREMAGTYVLCFDIVNFIAVNEISHEAGDIAILEILGRIEREAPDTMLLFRIGGDEFALATGLSDAAAAEEVAARVLARNGEAFDYQGRGIPLSLRAGCVRMEQKLKYDELFGALHGAIECARRNQ